VTGPDAAGLPGLVRLAEVMHAIRLGCPWDADQTHASLVRYLIEETAELVEAIETGDPDHLREELGDLLLQVFFHAEIASEAGRFTVDDVADSIADKLVRRHPYVFTDAAVPDDLNRSWERAKRLEKARDSSLDGIPPALDTLARAEKVVARARAHGVRLDLPSDNLESDAAGAALLALVSRAQASGVDADQALRAAVRSIENHIRAREVSRRRSESGTNERSLR
jgi:XTP/dITP diphosphohydrolase